MWLERGILQKNQGRLTFHGEVDYEETMVVLRRPQSDRKTVADLRALHNELVDLRGDDLREVMAASAEFIAFCARKAV
jgi:hypothetical protein